MKQSKVSALLLNWKRPENIKETINSIRNQNIDIDIWLWNNNAEDYNNYDVDYYFNSPINFMCWPRWFMGTLSESEYIFTLDDDVKLADNNIINDCISFCENKQDDIIIGFTGVILTDIDYFKCKHIKAQNIDTVVDIIKGRFMFMKRMLLNGVTMEKDNSCEDIKISSYSSQKIIPSILKNRFIDLKEGAEALFKQHGQKEKRIDAVNKYFFK